MNKRSSFLTWEYLLFELVNDQFQINEVCMMMFVFIVYVYLTSS